MKRCSNFYLRLSCFHWCSNSERNIQTFQLTTFTIHICCNEWIEWDKMKSISMFACTSPLDEEEKNQLVWREEVKKTVCPARVIGNAFLENLICFFFGSFMPSCIEFNHQIISHSFPQFLAKFKFQFINSESVIVIPLSNCVCVWLENVIH